MSGSAFSPACARRFPVRHLRADLANPRTVFLFFTFVAATDVLGIAIGVRGFASIALGMWVCALTIWVMLIYLGFGVLMFFNTPRRR